MNLLLTSLVTAVLLAFVLFLLLGQNSISNLELSPTRSPQRLGTSDIVSLYIKAIVKLVPGYAAPLHPNTARTGFAVPRIVVRGTLDISDEDVQAFDEAARTTTTEADRTGSFMFLVALTLPLLVEILTRKECPIKPLGSVNTRNIFRVHDPKSVRDLQRLQIEAKKGSIEYQAIFGGESGIRRKRGFEFCVRISILLHGKEILTQELWFLQFLPKSTAPRWKEEDEAKIDRLEPIMGETTVQALHLDTKDPQRWAKVCKDYNPIHISDLGAKLFGFKGVIAHGNHVAALVVEQLRRPGMESTKDAWSAAQRLCWKGEAGFEFEVRFVRPLGLPAQADVRWSSRDGRVGFDVLRNGKVCVEGRVSGEH